MVAAPIHLADAIRGWRHPPRTTGLTAMEAELHGYLPVRRVK